MIRKLILYAIFLFLPWIVDAKIIETPHIADAIPYVDKDTWFIIDLDNTMFEAKQALGHANWFSDLVRQKVQKGMTREEAIHEIYPIWVRTQAICSVKPIEESFVPTLTTLQEHGIVVMGITHRQPSVGHSTLRQIASLGCDLAKTAPSQDAFSVEAPTPTLYLPGVFFVGDFNNKGEVFLTFLLLIKQSPKKVVFIDDKRKNVDEFVQALSLHGIECIAFHYTAIDYVKPVFSRKIAELQYEYLDKILSNEAASLLLENGLE